MASEQRPASRPTAVIATSGALDDLVARLAQLDLDVAAADSVEALLHGARIDDASLAPFVHFLPGRYTRNCVYRNDRFELLLLCWAPGSQSPIHNHGGSRCFVKVERGSLEVENYALVGNGGTFENARLERSDTQILTPGAIDARSAARDIHRVFAPGAGAISLHVYAKPLDRCLVFDLARQACRVAVNTYDSRPSR